VPSFPRRHLQLAYQLLPPVNNSAAPEQRIPLRCNVGILPGRPAIMTALRRTTMTSMGRSFGADGESISPRSQASTLEPNPERGTGPGPRGTIGSLRASSRAQARAIAGRRSRLLSATTAMWRRPVRTVSVDGRRCLVGTGSSASATSQVRSLLLRAWRPVEQQKSHVTSWCPGRPI